MSIRSCTEIGFSTFYRIHGPNGSMTGHCEQAELGKVIGCSQASNELIATYPIDLNHRKPKPLIHLFLHPFIYSFFSSLVHSLRQESEKHSHPSLASQHLLSPVFGIAIIHLSIDLFIEAGDVERFTLKMACTFPVFPMLSHMRGLHRWITLARPIQHPWQHRHDHHPNTFESSFGFWLWFLQF